MKGVPTCLALVCLLGMVCGGNAQPQSNVPRVPYENPVHGFGLTIPEDWQMSPNKKGLITIAIDADLGASILWRQPILWCFRVKNPPQAQALALARDFKAAYGIDCVVRQRPNGADWEVLFSGNIIGGPTVQHWICKQQWGVNYCLGAMVRPEFAQAFAQDIEVALQTVHLVQMPGLKHFKEPTENAYRLSFPEGWRWEGEIYRDLVTPAYFVWKAQSPDGLTGAFSAPPANFNIQTPYIPGGAVVNTVVLPLLAKQVPGVRVESVHELPRASAHYRDAIRAAGIGENPKVDRVVADFLATVNSVPVRIRANVATVQLDSSPLLGGRGNWSLTVSGAWAPVAHFEQLYPVGRGVVTSLLTDAKFDKAMRVTSGEATDVKHQLDEVLAGKWIDFINQ